MNVMSTVRFPPGGPTKTEDGTFRRAAQPALSFLPDLLVTAAFGDTITPYGVTTAGSSWDRTSPPAGTTSASLYNPGTGTFTFLTPPGATNTIAIGINDSNQIVGNYGNSSGNYGYSYSGGTFCRMSVPGGNISPPYYYCGGAGTLASGVNDNGDIAGAWNPTASGPQEGFIYHGTAFTNTAILDGGVSTEVFGINDSGEISGYTVSGSGQSRVLRALSIAAASLRPLIFRVQARRSCRELTIAAMLWDFTTLTGYRRDSFIAAARSRPSPTPARTQPCCSVSAITGRSPETTAAPQARVHFPIQRLRDTAARWAGIRPRRFWLPHRNPARSRCSASD